MSKFFHGAKNTMILGGTFHHIGGDIVNNYGCQSRVMCRGREGGQLTPEEYGYREILTGDVIFGEETWSEETVIVVKIPSKNPFRKSVEKKIEVVKKFHNVSIFPHRDWRFTAVAFELADQGDNYLIRLIFEAYADKRSKWITQMFGSVRSDIPTIILHEELANGHEFGDRTYSNNIVFSFLKYTQWTAVQSLRVSQTVKTRVSDKWSDWTFNLKTSTWLYDPVTSTCPSVPWDDDYSGTPAPILKGKHPSLDVGAIVSCFNEACGDFLYLPASLGGCWTENLSNYATHGILTFGTVVNRRGRIIAYSPCTPSPKWHFEDCSINIKSHYSNQVFSRVDFHFQEIPLDETYIRLRFSLCLPIEHKIQLCTAYLSQTSHLEPDLSTYFVDEIRLELSGSLSRNSLTCSTPVYLFVPALRVSHINGLPSVHYPFTSSLLYWTFDPEGQHVIPEEDWERYTIPKLKLEMRLGSFWYAYHYKTVQNHLQSKNYPRDGKQYARDHGYPELVFGAYKALAVCLKYAEKRPIADPHDVKLEDTD